MGAVTIASTYNDVYGNKRVVEADITMSSSYATGGDTVTMSALGLREVTDLTVLSSVPSPNSGHGSLANHGLQLSLAGTSTAPKLKAYAGTTSEVSNATNLSTNGVVRVRFHGTA